MGKSRQSADLVSDNNIFIDIVNDRVGIGTTTPQYDLDVAGSLRVSGVVTATSFYGDGQYLQNVTSGVGVATAGGTVGTGATILDFRGAGISTVTVSAGIATINITGGVSTGDAYYRQVYSPTGVQTSFSFVNGYTSGYLDVYRNGAKLVPTLDYTATDGVNFSLTTPAQAGDNVEAVGYRVTSVAIVNGSVNSLIVSGIATVVGDTNLQSNVNVTGVVTATSFYGDGSGLSGVSPNRYLSIGSRVGIVTVDTYSGIFTVFGRNSNTNVPI